MSRVKEKEDQMQVFAAKFAFIEPRLHSWHLVPLRACTQYLLAPHWPQHSRKGCGGTISTLTRRQSGRAAKSKHSGIQILALTPTTSDLGK